MFIRQCHVEGRVEEETSVTNARRFEYRREQNAYSRVVVEHDGLLGDGSRLWNEKAENSWHQSVYWIPNFWYDSSSILIHLSNLQ